MQPPFPTPSRPGRRAALLAAALVLGLAVALRAANFAVPERSPDEQLYTRFGSHIAAEGPGYMARVVAEFNAGGGEDYPWPQRIGYMTLVGAAMRVSGDRTVRTPELLSTLSGIALVALAGAIAFEFLGPWTGVIAMLFLAVSPLDLALARRAWQDEVVALLTLLQVWAFLRHAARGGRASAAAFLALSAASLTVKESAVIATGLGVLGLAAIAWRRERSWRRPLAWLAAGALAALAAAAVIVAGAGGWAALRQTIELGRTANAPDEYMRHYQTGGVGYYLTGLRLLQPLPWLLGAAGALLALLSPGRLTAAGAPSTARASLRVLAVLVVGFCAVAFSYGSKNLRFLSPVYAPVALLAATLAWAALGEARRRLPRGPAIAAVTLLALGLAASAWRDVRTFDHYFNELQIQDLATPWFTETR